MDFFEYWHTCHKSLSTEHPNDRVVLGELESIDVNEFEFALPPGPFFGPLKNAKIVLCYANPSRDSKTSEVINSSDHLNQLFEQLDGLQPYPHKIPGWDSWFRPVANSLFDGDVIAASNNISVFNLVPYASTNMDRVKTFANCLPSVWAAQDYLRNTLIPKALQGDILLVMCRSSQLWGLRTPFGSEKNIVINRGARVGFTKETKETVIAWRKLLNLG